MTNDELADLSAWDLADVLRNPLGTAAAPSTTGEFRAALSESEAEAAQAAARRELRRLGYSGQEIDAIEGGDDSPIEQRM